MTIFVLHDGDGKITHVSGCDAVTWTAMQDVPDPFPGLSMLEIEEDPGDRLFYITSNYVLDGAVVPRQTMAPAISKTTITADGTDLCAITGLPQPCTVSIAGALTHDPFAVTDGELDLTCDHAGDLMVTVTADPAWLQWSTTIHAT